MAPHPMTVRCPVCGGPLHVLRAHCARCDVSVDGRFGLLEFNLLSAEMLDLLRLFIRSRGNLKEMGRVVGVSYPTIRARFEELLVALGYEAVPAPDAPALEQRTVLDALERGEIDVAEAVGRLRRASGPERGR